MVTLDEEPPHFAANGATLCANYFILTCIYNLSPLVASGSVADWLWAAAAAAVAIASAVHAGARASGAALRVPNVAQMQQEEMEKNAPTMIGTQPDGSGHTIAKPLLATQPVDGIQPPTTLGAEPNDGVRALAKPLLAVLPVDGPRTPAKPSLAAQRQAPNAKPLGSPRAPPVLLDVATMSHAGRV
jgi:hypothetical protein